MPTYRRPAVQSSLQTVESKQMPPVQVVGRGSRYDWDTTPGRLRVAVIILVFGVLLAGGVGVYTALARMSAIGAIAGNLEPLNATVTTLYRSLADADATVAAGFLSGGVEPSELRTRYGGDLVAAADSLAKAGTQAEGEMVTATLIDDITIQLPMYSGLVERARVNNRQGLPVGVAYLRRASELMQNSILPEAAELQQRQATRLRVAYQQAGSLALVALAAAGATLAGLIWAQVFLFNRTHRVFNIGLVAATGAVIAGLVWWTVVGVASANSLARAFGHSRSVSDALGPAQIAALQARAFESLELVDRNGEAIEPDFVARMQRLARDDGTGGALGAAKQFATDQTGSALVAAAVDGTREYARAHQEVRRLDNAGDYTKAVDIAVNTHQTSAAAAFDRLTATLNTAIKHERGAFGTDMDHARGWLTGLPIGIGGLALGAAVGVVLGVRQRLEEYR
jgi:hypothetical protein